MNVQKRKVMVVKGIFPSNSGNYRVMVMLNDLAKIHFYMKPDGTLHYPAKHNEKTLATAEKAANEFAWVMETWKKNPNFQVAEMKGDMRSKAIALAEALTKETFVDSQKPAAVTPVAAAPVTPPVAAPAPTNGETNPQILKFQNRVAKKKLAPNTLEANLDAKNPGIGAALRSMFAKKQKQA